MSKLSPAQITMNQEAELNAKAAAAEGFEQRMAFETYYKMGESRSLVKIAEQIHKHRTTVEEWSSKYRWTARVKEREMQAAEFMLMQQSAEEEAQVKKKHLTLIDASIGQWSKKLLAGEIRLKSIDDLDKLISLRWKLASMADKTVNPAAPAGGATSTIDLRLRGMERGELQAFLHQTLRSIERIMGKPKIADGAPSLEEESKDRIDLDLKMTKSKATPPPPGPVADFDVIDVDVSDIDFDADLEVD